MARAGRTAGAGADPGGRDHDPVWLERVRDRLVAWYPDARRDLPWRADPDPYRILVSEMMLVQTTVAAVVPFFERFLRRFPTVESLAEADEAEVLKAWEGLGYYRRARQLQAAAREIVAAHGGRVPDDPIALRALPGVGRYIAGAVLSMAFDQPEPILEANTRRVLARLIAWRGDLDDAATQTRLWEAAGRLVPRSGAGTFNQALMELGALVCAPKGPRCLVCPVASECEARAKGLQDDLPVTTPKPSPLAVVEACALVRREGRLLVLQRGGEGLWAGFWEFPTIHVSGADPASRRTAQGGVGVDLAVGVRRLTGVPVAVGPVVRTVRYSVTRHRVRLDAHEATAEQTRATPGPGFVGAAWVAPEELSEYPLGSAGRRLGGWLSGAGAGS